MKLLLDEFAVCRATLISGHVTDDQMEIEMFHYIKIKGVHLILRFKME